MAHALGLTQAPVSRRKLWVIDPGRDWFSDPWVLDRECHCDGVTEGFPPLTFHPTNEAATKGALRNADSTIASGHRFPTSPDRTIIVAT